MNIIRTAHSSLDHNTALRIAIKATNETMGPNGVLPSMQVFGTMLTFPTQANTNPIQAESFRAPALARSEMESITVENRIKIALRSYRQQHILSFATPTKFVYTEKNKHIERRL